MRSGNLPDWGFMKAKTIWALTDGKAGMINQARGLASAIAREIGGKVVEKVVVPQAPWSFLPAGFGLPVFLARDMVVMTSEHLGLKLLLAAGAMQLAQPFGLSEKTRAERL